MSITTKFYSGAVHLHKNIGKSFFFFFSIILVKIGSVNGSLVYTTTPRVWKNIPGQKSLLFCHLKQNKNIICSNKIATGLKMFRIYKPN